MRTHRRTPHRRAGPSPPPIFFLCVAAYAPNTKKAGGLILNNQIYEAVAKIIPGATEEVVKLEKAKKSEELGKALKEARDQVVKFYPGYSSPPPYPYTDEGSTYGATEDMMPFNQDYKSKSDFDEKVADLRNVATETLNAAVSVFQLKVAEYKKKNRGSTDSDAEAAVRAAEKNLKQCFFNWWNPFSSNSVERCCHSCSWYIDETKKVLASVEPDKVHKWRARFQELGSFLFVDPEAADAREVKLDSAGTLPMPAPPGCKTTDTVKMATPVPEAQHWWQFLRGIPLSKDRNNEELHLKPFGMHRFDTACPEAAKDADRGSWERVAVVRAVTVASPPHNRRTALSPCARHSPVPAPVPAPAPVHASFPAHAQSPYEGPLPTKWRHSDNIPSLTYGNALSLLRPFIWVRRAYDLPLMALTPAALAGGIDILKAHRHRADSCDGDAKLYIPRTT